MWTDEMFDEIQKGDKVWYCGTDEDTVHGPVKALILVPWVGSVTRVTDNP